MPGPPPKRSSHRRRTNKTKVPITAGSGARKVSVPRPDPKWHKVAKRWYNSLARSGQAEFYEPSDWAIAFLLAESISRDLEPRVVSVTKEGEVIKATVPINGASMTAYLRAMSALLVTEGDRRRVSIELQRGGEVEEEAADGVSDLDEYRERLRSG